MAPLLITRRVAAALIALASLAGPVAVRAEHPVTRQANAGDSVSQAMGATGRIGDQPAWSFVQGTEPEVRSIFSRHREVYPAITQQPESVSGSEQVGGGDNFAAQAHRICAMSPRPMRVYVLFGGNDICNRERASGPDAAASLYSVETYVNALRAGLDQLADCLPLGAGVHLVSAPRVDFLYDAGREKSAWCPVVWSTVGICRLITGEADPARRLAIGKRIDEYNAAMATELLVYHFNANARNRRAIRFSGDWVGSIDQGFRNTSFGTFQFRGVDINGVDCFHPNTEGQRKLACATWASHVDGAGPVQPCFEGTK